MKASITGFNKNLWNLDITIYGEVPPQSISGWIDMDFYFIKYSVSFKIWTNRYFPLLSAIENQNESSHINCNPLSSYNPYSTFLQRIQYSATNPIVRQQQRIQGLGNCGKRLRNENGSGRKRCQATECTRSCLENGRQDQ